MNGNILRFNFVLLVFLVLEGGVVHSQTARELFLDAQHIVQQYPINKDIDMLLRAVETLLRATEINSAYADAYQALARAYYYLKEYKQAQQYLEKAMNFSKYSVDLSALKGRILLAQYKIKEAESIFQTIVKEYPYHTQALLGLGDISLLLQSERKAIAYYKKVLVGDPRELSALLSLLIVHYFLGQYSDAQTYLFLALRYHHRNPEVQYYAAWYYRMQGNLQKASVHIVKAITLRDNFISAFILQAEINIARGDFKEAQEVITHITAYDKQSLLAWYAQGRIAQVNGDVKDAIYAYKRALSINPEDNVLRLAFDHIMIKQRNPQDAIRKEASRYYLRQAHQFRVLFQNDRAKHMLRRGLRLNPFSITMRRMLADIYREEKDYQNYLSEITILQELGETDQSVRDAVDTFKHYLANSVSNRWGVDQFAISRPRINLALFCLNTVSPEAKYPFSNDLYLWYLSELFLPSERVEISGKPLLIREKAEALLRANLVKSDYFLVMEPMEGSSFLQIKMLLYKSSSGLLLEENTLFSSVQQRVDVLLSDIVKRTERIIPSRGTVLDRKGGKILFSLGIEDGLTRDDMLRVISYDKLRSTADDASAKNVAGRIKITALDALVGEGTYIPGTAYKNLNIGDWVFLVPSDDTSGDSKNTVNKVETLSLLYDEIKKIR